MAVLKLRTIDDGVGATFPPELLDLLGVREGDTLRVSEGPGGIVISRASALEDEASYGHVFKNQMEAARTIMRERRGVLRNLAR